MSSTTGNSTGHGHSSHSTGHGHSTKNGRLGESQGSHELSDDLATLRANIGELKNDMTRVLGHLVDVGKTGKDMAVNQASHAVDATKERMHDAMDTVKDRAGEAKEYGQDVLDQVTKKVRANPGTATLIAFGVGFVASRLLMHRR